MFYITPDEIVLIHDKIVEEIGGSLGVREPGLLEAIAAKPQASYGNAELYPTIYDKAAAIFEALCNYRVFVDGNKRTAIACLEYFLFKNGFVLKISSVKKEKFTLQTANSHPDLADVATWIETHIKKVQ
ncbi:MAG: type II toxin-antitoxin system death-on-curing family toxin [Candidatus Saccharimonadales bacterium]